jgi:hypothetical protein
MPARHKSLATVCFLKADIPSEGSGRRKRVSARHQVKRLDRIFEGFALFWKAGLAEETSFLRSVRNLRPQFRGADSQGP